MLGNIILKYILISVLVSSIFGAEVLSSNIADKFKKCKFISSYFFQLWSLAIFIVFWLFNKSKLEIFEVNRLFSYKNILLILIAVIPTSVIACISKTSGTRNAPRLVDFIDGASMEIVQRLLVQNMFVILNVNIVIYGSMTLAILLNSLIWVQFIIIQELIFNRKITKSIIPEITASAWFSIWVGILYSITGNIIASMIAHGLERIVTKWIKQNFNYKDYAYTDDMMGK